MFNIHKANVKSAHLLHKMARGYTFVVGSVQKNKRYPLSLPRGTFTKATKVKNISGATDI